MSRAIKDAVSLLSLFFVTACAPAAQGMNPQISKFIQLLVRTDPPTLSEFAVFGGECGGESELVFELQECRSRGWDDTSRTCIDFTQQRCSRANREHSLALSWLRERFSTVGKSWKLIGVRAESAGFRHELVEVEIGSNKFLLFHNLDPSVPTGLVIGVSKVNEKPISEYLTSPGKGAGIVTH